MQITNSHGRTPVGAGGGDYTYIHINKLATTRNLADPAGGGRFHTSIYMQAILHI
jgi:hypothetical protein